MRTVENDIEIIDDPMGEEYIPEKPNPFNRKASLQLKIVAHTNDTQNSRNINIHRYVRTRCQETVCCESIVTA